MINRVVFVVSVGALLGLSGCGLSARQQSDIVRWEAEAVELGHPEVKYREHLSPGTATGLGFLPFGIAGIYVHRPGLAVTGFLFWPLSLTWVPAVAAKSAHNWNYNELEQEMAALREEALWRAVHSSGRADDAPSSAALEQLRASGRISESEYLEIRYNLRRGAPAARGSTTEQSR